MSFPKIAVVGAGNLSTRRIYPYLATAGAKLVGVCDLDLEKAARNAELFGGKPYDDMDKMLDAAQPDGVIVCVGPEAHAELAPKIMRHGLPVYTEKPPAACAEDALKVARVSEETGQLCVTAFKKRYSRAYTRAKKFIEEFGPEELESLSIDYASSRYTNESFRTSFLLDFCIHMIDLSGYLFGDAEQVFVFAREKHSYAVSVRYASGAVGSFNFTDGRSFQIPTEEVEITAAGGNFMSVHNSSQWRIARDGECVEYREPPTFVSGGDSGRDTGHLSELEDFIDAVRTGRKESRSSVQNSYRSMVLYEGIVRSCEKSESVNLTYEEVEKA
ncbi:MAG: Gfo/Idh/MocA family protein [Candidatus Brocadiia bacterium]